MKICIDGDRTGNAMVPTLLKLLADIKIFSLPYGTEYPDVAYQMAKSISDGEYDRGILVCGTGLGMAMMANKVKGIYAGNPYTVESARHMAFSMNAQIITIGCKVTPAARAADMIRAWLETPFDVRPNAQRMRALEALG